MRGRMLKVFMVLLVLLPVGLTAYLANSLYHRKGVPEALENLTRQLFQSKEEERRAETRANELERKTEELQTAYDSLVADLRGEVDSRDIRVRQFREKLEINFVDKVLFASGSAEVTPKGRDILRRVGAVLAKVKGKSIYVVGHTDNVPIHSSLFPSNWELSASRASSVIRHLSETGGLPPERFTAMGRAFYQPVASNATPEGRQENRRVDIIVADVPLLAGEGGSESLRGTVSGGPARPGEGGPDSGAQPLRETAPSPGPVPGSPEPAASDSGAAQPAGPGAAAVPPGAAEPAPTVAPAAPPDAGATPRQDQPDQPAAGTPAATGATPAISGETATPGAAGTATTAGSAGASETPETPAGPELPPPLPDKPEHGQGPSGS
ncbi:OmpA/MotB family protein [Solidesulfovibrio sp.]